MMQWLLSSCPLFKCKCQFEGVNWESIRSKYGRIQEKIVESYPKISEESKDFPSLKNCNRIVFFAIYAFSFIKNVFRINAILCSR